MIKARVIIISAVLEPSTVRSATTEFAGFDNSTALGACGADCFVAMCSVVTNGADMFFWPVTSYRYALRSYFLGYTRMHAQSVNHGLTWACVFAGL